jgi:hypothetical protein
LSTTIAAFLVIESCTGPGAQGGIGSPPNALAIK